MTLWMRVSLLAAAAALSVACTGSTNPAATARVRFVIDAPFCGNSYPVNFFIDDVQVGRDTMWFGFVADTSSAGGAGSQTLRWYRSFSVQPGSHQLRAAIVDTISPSVPFVYDWPDTTVAVAAGAEVVRTLPFYCS
jgi:hypothetical protein